MALVAATTAVRLVDLDAPWDLALYLVVIAIMLLGGTLWHVPTFGGKQAHRTRTRQPR